MTPAGLPTKEVVVPLEMGPPLEWCEESKWYPLQGALFYLCLFALFCTVIYKGFEWTTNWFLWVFITVICVMMYTKFSRDRVIAGARWIQLSNQWISTYEIIRIRSTTDGLMRAMSLRDAQGNKLVLNLTQTQQNPLIWDLVYNGIVHSLASGDCDVSRAARRILKV